MANCAVSGVVLNPSGAAIIGIPVSFNTQTSTLQADIVSTSTTTDSNGAWTLSVQQGLSGVFTISVATGNSGRALPFRFNVNIPANSTATFSSILVDT